MGTFVHTNVHSVIWILLKFISLPLIYLNSVLSIMCLNTNENILNFFIIVYIYMHINPLYVFIQQKTMNIVNK